MPLLTTEQICRRFGPVTVLEGVDLTIEAGEIHALVGENGAGKSTLMKILCGALCADGGTIRWQGEPVRFLSPRAARERGIAMIHQELALVPELSVAENICLGERRSWWQPVDFARLETRAREVLDRLGQRLDPSLPVRSLSLPDQQLVETGRALFQRARLLILDEPTAALGAHQTEQLFAVLRRIREEGTAIIYISHRLEEIFSLCDRITVLRNGRQVHTGPVAELTPSEVVQHMVGRTVSLSTRTATARPEKVLEVRDLVCGPLHRVNLSLSVGEVLGIVGLSGSGRSRLVRILFGAHKPESGRMVLGGKPYAPGSPREAIAKGISLLAEDRKRQSLLPLRPVRENMALASLDRRRRWGFVHARRERTDCNHLAGQLRLKCASQEISIRSLSGGNQQKALLGRLLLTDYRVLLLDEPTRGVDIEAKAEIYQLIDNLAAQGTAVIVVSSDLPELMQLCERLLILRRGQGIAEARPPYDARALLAEAMGMPLV